MILVAYQILAQLAPELFRSPGYPDTPERAAKQALPLAQVTASSPGRHRGFSKNRDTDPEARALEIADIV